MVLDSGGELLLLNLNLNLPDLTTETTLVQLPPVPLSDTRPPGCPGLWPIRVSKFSPEWWPVRLRVLAFNSRTPEFRAPH